MKKESSATPLYSVPSLFIEKIVPWIIFLSTTVVVATVYMTQPIMVELGHAFQMKAEDMGLVMSIVSFTYALSFLFYGPLSDRFGRRFFLLFGVAALAVTLLVASQSSTFIQFLIVTSIQGVVAGALPSVAVPYMADITPKEKIGQAMGIALSGTIAGTVVGRSLSGILTDAVGWRWTYVIYAVLLVIFFFILRMLPHKPVPHSQVSVFNVVAQMGSLFRDMRINLFLLLGSSLFFAYLGLISYLTPYLSAPPFQLNSSTIGLLSLAGIVGIFASPVAGKAIAKWGAMKVMLFGLGFAFLSIQIMAYQPSVVLVILGLVCLYGGVFICQPAVMSILTTHVDASRRGSMSSLYLLACMFGGSVGSYTLKTVYLQAHWLGISIASAIACGLALILAVTANFITKKKVEFEI